MLYPPPLPPSALQLRSASLKALVSFLSLVISAFVWKPNTSGGVTVIIK